MLSEKEEDEVKSESRRGRNGEISIKVDFFAELFGRINFYAYFCSTI